jgi:CDP-diacylglycerol--glycerol-3-phosphate 3-phosphatidyltransferase
MKFREVFQEKILNIPNSITILRILLLPFLIYFSYDYFSYKSHKIYVLIFAIVIFLTDFLDGFIARILGQETKLGKYFDPIADMLTIISLLFLLVLIKGFPLWIFILYFLREIGSIYIGSYLYFKKDKQAQPSLLGKIITAYAFFLIFLYYWEEYIPINLMLGNYIFALLIIVNYFESFFRFRNDLF